MLKVVVFNAVTFNDNSFIVGIKRVPKSENDNGNIFGNIVVYLHIYIYIYICLSLCDYISLDFIRLHQTLMPMTLVIDSYIISTTLILNTLLFPSHRYSSVPKILHLNVKFF